MLSALEGNHYIFTMARSDVWTKVAVLAEENAAGHMCTFGRHEILAISGKEEMIYKMDGTTCQWSKHLHYRNCFLSRRVLAIPDSMSSIYAFELDNMRIYDISTQKWREISDIEHNNKGSGLVQHHMFNVKNEIHFLGGDYNALHQIFDEHNKQLVPIYRFEEFQFILNPFCIHVPSKDMILLIGGTTMGSDVDREYGRCHDQYIYLGIYRFSIRNKEWKRIENIDFAYANCQAVLSDDEKHVIIAAAMYDNVEAMYILDLCENNEFKLRKIDFDGPKEATVNEYALLKTGGLKDEGLVFGYIKDLYTRNEIMRMPPIHLMHVIRCFFYQTTVHWIERGNPMGHLVDPPEYGHWTIPIRRILFSKTENVEDQTELGAQLPLKQIESH